MNRALGKELMLMNKWVKVFKNESTKICERQSLKNLKWYCMVCLSRPYHFKFFKRYLLQYLVHFWIPWCYGDSREDNASRRCLSVIDYLLQKKVRHKKIKSKITLSKFKNNVLLLRKTLRLHVMITKVELIWTPSSYMSLLRSVSPTRINHGIWKLGNRKMMLS